MVEKLAFCDKLELICGLYSKNHKRTISEVAIDTIEKHLQITMPKALRDFYLVVGADVDILKSMYNIAAPQELYVEDNTIMLAVEYQNVCGYGIDLESERPVYFDISNNIREILEQDIEDFLVYLLAIQGTECLPCVGKISIDSVSNLKKCLSRLTKTEGDCSVLCSRNGIIAFMAGQEVFLCAQTDAYMEALEADCELEIDYL